MGSQALPFWHPFATGDGQGLGVPITTLPFLDTVKRGLLPNVSFVDPAFDTEGNGTSADDHPLADIRLGERFIADTHHALASAGYLENTVLVVTFDEWGGFYDHVPLIESTFGLTPLTARDANARDLGTVLRDTPRHDPVPEGAIPTSEQALGPVSDAAAICGADSVKSVSPQPLQVGAGPRSDVLVPRSGAPTGAGMVGLGRELRNRQ